MFDTIRRRRTIGVNFSKQSLIGSAYFQLFVGCALVLGASWAAVPNNRQFSFDTNVLNTLAGSGFAFSLGFFLLMKIASFPGTRVIGYIIPIFTTSFMAVFSAFLLIRLEYGRIQFLSSFLFTILWFGFILSLARRYSHQTFAIIPYGEGPSLADLPGIRWHILSDPARVPWQTNAIVADLGADLPPNWQHFLTESVLAGTPVFNVKQIREVLTGRVEILHLSENTLGSLNPNDSYLKLKRCLDFLTAMTALVLLLPALLVLGLVVMLDSPGPALFRQTRIGRGGREFVMYKFRTMVSVNAGEDTRDSAQTRNRDARVTRIGRVLRPTRMDELPQIFNILRGEMSWIGPRPEAVPLVRWYESELPFYRYRHILRPGITGWAQVNQGHVTDVDEVMEKLHYDFFYIKNFSAWLDILISLKTVKIMISGFGAR